MLIVLVGMVLGGMAVHIGLYRGRQVRQSDAEHARRLEAALFARKREDK